MERIAILSDVHGNMPALEAVLADIRARGISRIVCLGDLAGKGPEPAEAVDEVRSSCETVIRGNWDEFLGLPTDDETLRWHQERLGPERLRYLRELPFCAELRLGGRLIRLVHASPQSVYRRVQPWDSPEDRASMFDPPDGCSGRPDALGYGDIHQAYAQYVDGRLLFNCGSVGNPLDLPQASYAIVEGEPDAAAMAPFALQLIRVPYDIGEAVARAERLAMPQLEPYCRELVTGRYRGLQA
ncbi:metallophosphoesterase family protein [Paenibacillus pasadenensis]|uniref:Serine/threonine protein phosphatase n=1 Tax=Paenibacillus pasadenensis TaxID=217090 RepID=A0A2N5N4W4_9BACL|nr:metallophosphoesterase family protein [Paenibacillus pasadenensis]PLT45385.1 serine/threonine protein phosphatase [Paenibacillus pasadenensis]